MKVEIPYAKIREDYKVTEQENRWRPESITFERCRLSRNGIAVRVLLMRTSTNYWGNLTGNRTLEFMAEHRLRDLFPLTDGDEIEISFYSNIKDATAATGLWLNPLNEC